MDLGLGTVLLGKYRVDEVLGTGGMGRVVRASHLYLQQSVAIKILLPEMVESANTVSRFLQEAQSTVKLRSEHIARVYDVGTAPDGCPFIIMEFLEGNDLNQVLRHHGPQQPQVVCDLMLQACEGIAEAHALGIVHRDIKPSNFFITRRIDGTMLLKILDFGISKSPNKLNLSELTGTQTIIGTPTYMAPEQMKSGKETGPRSDIWSMGVVMYQLLNGRPPFHGDSYAELVLKVNSEPPAPMHVTLPAGFGEVILRCLEKDPRFRIQNVAELARMLAPYATDPLAGAQSAARTARILQQRSGMTGQQGLAIAAGGGLTTPVPQAPAQFTPRSWPPTGSSVSQGAGQMTVRTRSNRGWIIAGVASIVIIAGASGYIVSSVINHDTKVAASETSPPPPAEDTAGAAPAPEVTPASKAALPAVPTPTPTVAAPTTSPDVGATAGSGSGSAAPVRPPTVAAPTPPIATTPTTPAVTQPPTVATPTVPTPTVPTPPQTTKSEKPATTPPQTTKSEKPATTPPQTTKTEKPVTTPPQTTKSEKPATTPPQTTKSEKPATTKSDKPSSPKKKRKTRNDDELFGGRK